MEVKRLADFVVTGLSGAEGRFLISPHWEDRVDGVPGAIGEICGIQTQIDPCLFVCLIRDSEKIMRGMEVECADMFCAQLSIPARSTYLLARDVYLPPRASRRWRNIPVTAAVVVLRTNCGFLDVDACGAVEFLASDDEATCLWSGGDPVVIFRDRPEHTEQ